MGVRGSLRSLYNTFQQDSLILSTSKALTEVASSASVSGAPLVLGYNKANEDHPLRARSLLSMGPNSELVMTGEQGALIGTGSILRVDGELLLGDCFINSDTRIICEDRITIGDGCSISWDVTILDSDRHDIIKPNGPSEKSKPIQIKKNVLIGHSVSVSKGVTIGEGAVVAAGSAVIDDVESDTIVAGSPAKTVDHVSNWN